MFFFLHKYASLSYRFRGVLVTFCHHCDKILERNNLKEEALFWLTVQDGEVQNGEEGMADFTVTYGYFKRSMKLLIYILADRKTEHSQPEPRPHYYP